MHWRLVNITKIKRANLSCLSYNRLLNAEVSVSMIFCLLCYVFFWTFWGWGIATLFSPTAVESRLDRTGQSDMAGGRTGNLTSSAFRLLSSFPLDWLSSFASLGFLAYAPSPLDRISHISKWLSGKGTHMAADNSRTGPEASAGIHLKSEVSCNSILCGDHFEPTLLFVNCKWKLNKG